MRQLLNDGWTRKTMQMHASCYPVRDCLPLNIFWDALTPLRALLLVSQTLCSGLKMYQCTTLVFELRAGPATLQIDYLRILESHDLVKLSTENRCTTQVTISDRLQYLVVKSMPCTERVTTWTQSANSLNEKRYGAQACRSQCHEIRWIWGHSPKPPNQKRPAL